MLLYFVHHFLKFESLGHRSSLIRDMSYFLRISGKFERNSIQIGIKP
jgi:hypothetical protein